MFAPLIATACAEGQGAVPRRASQALIPAGSLIDDFTTGLDSPPPETCSCCP
jgi:hypothetical protein